MNTLLNKKQRRTLDILTALAATTAVLWIILADNPWWPYILAWLASLVFTGFIMYAIGHDQGVGKGLAAGYIEYQKTVKP